MNNNTKKMEKIIWSSTTTSSTSLCFSLPPLIFLLLLFLLECHSTITAIILLLFGLPPLLFLSSIVTIGVVLLLLFQPYIFSFQQTSPFPSSIFLFLSLYVFHPPTLLVLAPQLSFLFYLFLWAGEGCLFIFSFARYVFCLCSILRLYDIRRFGFLLILSIFDPF